jgi:hypothetical protein
MTKQYRLLKDMPNLKAGAVLTLSDTREMYAIENDRGGKFFQMYASTVENNPEWFEEVKQEPNWTERLEAEWRKTTGINFFEFLYQNYGEPKKRSERNEEKGTDARVAEAITAFFNERRAELIKRINNR